MMTTGKSLPVINEETLAPFIQAYRAQTGRPTSYNEIVAAEIIERLANGETMLAICKLQHMPSYSTVYDWAKNSPGFADTIATARRRQATAFVEEGKQILDDACTDSMAHIQKADKRAQYRLTLAKCFDREQYGDKVQQDVNIRGVVIHTDNTKLAQLMDDGN
jgi:hypothetical protein